MEAHSYKNIPVAVTGGAGFIGSHLVNKLVTLGATVTVLDDLSTGTLNNLSSVLHAINFIEGSITDSVACQNALKGQKIVFHLAAQVSVPESFENPSFCYQVNMHGTQQILEAARIMGVQRFIFSSSCAAYGSHDRPLHEHLPCHPQSPYGLSKLIGEMLCMQYMKNFGLEVACLRYFNVFSAEEGANVQYSGVVSKFRSNMQNNNPLIIFGDGLQYRDFVPVSTVAAANIIAAIAPQEQVNGQIFNVASGTSITVLQLIEQLKHEYPHFNAAIYHKPGRPGDVQAVHADIKKYSALIHSNASLL